ncbi:MAG TPA: hypothetical protein VGF22_02830 [Acidimicrobiales bacterium]|jgi:hypothetical protein
MSVDTIAIRPSSSVAHRVALGAGVLLHLVVGVFVLSSGLLMPPWAVAGLAVLWLVGFFVVYRYRSRPIVAFVVPAATMGLWFLTGWAGETFLGWTG